MIDFSNHAFTYLKMPFMPDQPLIDQIAERVERLLVRHEELQRTNALLSQQVQELALERDLLKSRLGAARQRIDSLIDRLPQNAATKEAP